jgi:SAM-dependent methyltransferase
MNQERQQELLEIVKKNYQEIAQDFDTTRKKVIWPTIVDLAQGVRDGERVLDVGCGNGRLLQVFAGRKVEYVGTDLSSNLIELAQKNAENNLESRKSKFEFLIGNILELEKLDIGKFDWIFSHAVIHHLPGQDLQLKALANLKSKLKPDGKLVISVWRPWGNKKLVRELWKTIGRKIIGRHPYAWNDLVFEWKNNQSPRYYHFFTKCELKRLVKKAGLNIVDFRAEQRNYYLTLK